MLVLRLIMLDICIEVFRNNFLPEKWNKDVTILIHKNNDSSLPETFK